MQRRYWINEKELQQTIEIPDGVEVNLDGSSVTIKGKEGEIKRIFDLGKLDFEKKIIKYLLEIKINKEGKENDEHDFATH